MVYSFNINNRALKAIVDGRKKYEIRVTKVNGSFDYSVMRVGDYIKFTSYDYEKIICRVVEVDWYHTAEDLLRDKGTKYTLSSTDDFDEGIKSLNSFSGYKEGIEKNGIYAIGIEVVDEILEKVSLSDFCFQNNHIDLDVYIFNREKIKKDMSFPEWLGDFDKNSLEKMLLNGSKIWMYYHKNNFVCSMMFIPATIDDMEKFGINYNYLEVVDYGPMMVSSNYQGNGLQCNMLVELDNICKNMGYKYAVATVHPDNLISLKNLEKVGFELVGCKQFARGLRTIYLKKLVS